MGGNIQVPVAREVAELDRMIEGRFNLINRLFADIQELVAERDRIVGGKPETTAKLFGRRLAPIPAVTFKVRPPPRDAPPEEVAELTADVRLHTRVSAAI